MLFTRIVAAGVLMLCLPCTARAVPQVDCAAGLAAKIPARPVSAPTGSAFAEAVQDLEGKARESAILAQIKAGNVPNMLRSLKPVEISAEDASGHRVSATICVTPDYLAIGSDRDFLRIPVDLHTARAVADSFGFVLPTRTMVDAIYDQASIQLTPRPMTPGPEMTSTGYYVDHNDSIQDQLPSSFRGQLIAGHKKDLVLTNRLRAKPGRIAIYGWHRRDGQPIQPLSTVHGAGYADYSHGIRLVSQTLYINGEAQSIFEVLKDEQIAGVVSDEGTIDKARNLMDASG